MSGNTKLVDGGIDYLRVTTQNRGQAAELFRYFRKILARDQALGYEGRAGGAFGFIGTKCRHALFGEKKGWTMLQASGYEAKRGWTLAQPETQATRIDLQLTVWVGEEAVERTIREAYRDACNHKRAKARPSEVTLIEKRQRAQTVYVGKRASDLYFRIYDKHAESGKEEHKGCVRFEVEIKGRLSKALWQALVLHKTTLAAMLQMVLDTFAERGVEIPIEALDTHDILLLKAEPTKEASTIGWLAQQVAPTVKRLSAERGWIFCFSVLFSEAVDEAARRGIMSTLSRVWGS